MRIIYFDCFSGISGDMLLAALFDAGLSFQAWSAEMDKLALDENPRFSLEKVSRGGISATLFNIECQNDGHHERKLDDMLRILDRGSIDPDIKERSANAFRRLAACEAEIHGRDIADVHFHELSGLDTIVDIVGAFTAVKLLGADAAASSPVNVGSGIVECAHGILPVPAPATAKLLEGVPIYSRFEKELTTPTGALLLTELTRSFGDLPLMTVESIGYGAGGEKRHQPNVLRVIIGDVHAAEEINSQEIIHHVSTNIDDTDPRAVGYLLERVLEEGALDAYIEPIFMKKNRPGVVFNVLCGAEFVGKAIDMILSETMSLGVRVVPTPRMCINRRNEIIETPFGPIKVKLAIINGSVRRANPEYEDCARAARETGRPLIEVLETVRRVAETAFVSPFDGGNNSKES
ncbi:MAG: nickel pincer cofactor biosynthesis protein LarC [bacterium]